TSYCGRTARPLRWAWRRSASTASACSAWADTSPAAGSGSWSYFVSHCGPERTTSAPPPIERRAWVRYVSDVEATCLRRGCPSERSRTRPLGSSLPAVPTFHRHRPRRSCARHIQANWELGKARHERPTRRQQQVLNFLRSYRHVYDRSPLSAISAGTWVREA